MGRRVTDEHPGPGGRQELAAIGLGANVGPARQTLVDAVAGLRALPGASLVGVSRLYRTRPVGPVVQDDFWNAAVAVAVPAGPSPGEGAMALLVALKGLERALGRQDRERWGPRELDLDLLLFGSHRLHLTREPAARSDDPARATVQWLEVPHPLASERLFVLAPLADILPDLEPPGWGTSVTAARERARLHEGPDAVRVVGTWDAARRDWRDLRDDRRHPGVSGGSGVAP